MKIIITTKNIETTEALKSYLDKKLEKLAHHLPGAAEAKVEITRQRAKEPQERYIVQLTIDNNGTLLRAEDNASVLYGAIDYVVEVMGRQIDRYRSRLHDRTRGHPSIRAPIPQELPPLEPSGKVVKVKHFVVKPMSAEEAAEQMELLGHDFFLFYNEPMKTFNLLYRRKDGNYGLIVPELG
jgi:putative sigma-54 modulation protein